MKSKKIIRRKKILIIGGTGFIGFHLCKYFLKKKMLVLSISLSKPKRMRRLKKVRYLIADISNEKKLSIISLISEKNKFKNLVIVNDFKNEIKKTKEINKILTKFNLNNSLIILDKVSKDKIYKSSRNIPNIKLTDVNHFNAFDIVKFKKIVFTETSVKELEKRYV